MELQQSPLYATYIKNLNWQVEIVDGVQIFLRKFPLAGGFAKIQRLQTIPDIDKLLTLFKKYKVKRLVLEASQDMNPDLFNNLANELRKHISILESPFIPTKTIQVDLTPSEEEIFQRFSEAKRRAVRRAIKNELKVIESDNVEQLIKAKNQSGGIFGFITTTGVKQIWSAFRPHNATTVLAYTPGNNQLIGGILLIFWEDTAYYWIAGATKKGKKLFAPTLLVWEAIKISKKRNLKFFDFLGVWDERYPHDNKDWLGFTKFKEGFGGKTLYYPTHKKSSK